MAAGWPLRLIALVVTAAVASSPAFAQSTATFNLPSQPLPQALPAFARQAGVQILAPTGEIASVRSPPLAGSMDVRRALRRLIAGSGLEIASDQGGVILLRVAQGQASQRLIDGEPALLSEVVVTALRRETSASRTPISMVVLQGEDLDLRGASSLTELQPLAPGLNLTEINPGQRRLSIRGAQSAGENTVALYLGETPVTGPNSATSDPSSITPDIDFYDSARIEVLKGPQGTLFGSGAMSGAVRVVHNRPDLDEMSARVDAGASVVEGGGAGGSLHGMANLPLIGSRLGLRLVGYDVDRPGFVDNTVLAQQDVNSVRTRGARAVVRYEATGTTTLTVTGLFQDQHVRDASTFDGTDDGYRSKALATLPFPNRFGLVNAVLEQDFGFARLVASWSGYDWTATKYIDSSQAALMARQTGAQCSRYVGAPAPCDAGQLQQYRTYIDGIMPLVGYQPMSVRSRINELRLHSRPGGAIDWTLGAFVEDRDDTASSATVESDPLTGLVETPIRYTFQRRNSVSLVQKAVFGEFGYAVTPDLRLRLGARRYQYDKRSSSQVLITSFINASVAGPEAVYENDADRWVGRAAASYQLNPHLMLYGQYSEGFRPGGVNNTPGLDPELVTFSADEVRSGELGLKSTARDGRLLVDFALYQVKWDDMQVQARVPNFIFIANAGAATIRGVEVEGQVLFDEAWKARWSVNLIEGQLTSPAPTGRFDVSGRIGDHIPYEPDLRLSAAVENLMTFERGLTVRSSLEGVYIGTASSTFDRSDVYAETMGGYAVVNAASSLEAGDWRLGLRISNMFGSRGRIWVASRAELEQSTIAVTPRRLELFLGRRW